jgi:autoinducer 2-degrading protein
MYGVFWSVLTRPAHKTEVAAFLLEDGSWSLANEPGTLRFDIYEDQAEPARIWVYEAYTDPDAFQAHRGGVYFAKFFNDVMPRCCEGGVQPAMRWTYSIDAS